MSKDNFIGPGSSDVDPEAGGWISSISDDLKPKQWHQKPFFVALTEALDELIPKKAASMGMETAAATGPDQGDDIYHVITPPSSDIYSQNQDDLQGRRQTRSNPFQETVINCHSFKQSAAPLVFSTTGNT